MPRAALALSDRALSVVDAPADVAAERIASLDALRGLCALAVTVYHLGVWTRAFQGELRSAVVVLGVYAVETFFLISGFCFFHLYGQSRFAPSALSRFHVKRFFRIAPLYYLAVLLGVAFGIDQSVGPRVDAARVVENLGLAFGLFHPNHSMVLGGWSIGIEYVFYLALPLLVWATRHRVVLYALAGLLALWAVPYTFGAVQAAPEPQRFHSYVAIPNQAFLFLFGAVIADLRGRIALRVSPSFVLAVLALAFWAAARTQPPFVDHLEVMVGVARVRYVGLVTLSVLLCAFVSPTTPTTLRPLLGLGELSYSLYLMHPFAWLSINGGVAGQPPIVQVALGVLASLALAALSRACLEHPMEVLGRRLAARIRARP